MNFRVSDRQSWDNLERLTIEAPTNKVWRAIELLSADGWKLQKAKRIWYSPDRTKMEFERLRK